GMCALATFLQQLFDEGKVWLRDQPVPSTGETSRQALALLEAAYGDYRLNIAGPLIEFDRGTAVASAQLVHRAGWYRPNRAEQEADLRDRLVLPGPPVTPAEHLSADLVLRYLPQIHRRAHALAPADVLPGLLAGVLRRWPLTGVLSD